MDVVEVPFGILVAVSELGMTFRVILHHLARPDLSFVVYLPEDGMTIHRGSYQVGGQHLVDSLTLHSVPLDSCPYPLHQCVVLKTCSGLDD